MHSFNIAADFFYQIKNSITGYNARFFLFNYEISCEILDCKLVNHGIFEGNIGMEKHKAVQG
jgi:hypothetical protein